MASEPSATLVVVTCSGVARTGVYQGHDCDCCDQPDEDTPESDCNRHRTMMVSVADDEDACQVQKVITGGSQPLLQAMQHIFDKTQASFGAAFPVQWHRDCVAVVDDADKPAFAIVLENQGFLLYNVLLDADTDTRVYHVRLVVCARGSRACDILMGLLQQRAAAHARKHRRVLGTLEVVSEDAQRAYERCGWFLTQEMRDGFPVMCRAYCGANTPCTKTWLLRGGTAGSFRVHAEAVEAVREGACVTVRWDATCVALLECEVHELAADECTQLDAHRVEPCCRVFHVSSLEADCTVRAKLVKL